MKDDELIISGFKSDRDSEGLPKIDFTKSRSLSRLGSTCDAYECTIQRRKVFVKRLKAEYRDNPFYRAAFDKEYDLGVSLSHPSLPHYAGFGGDYIIMDFIEGDTLADLIKRADPRLKDEKFIRKVLSELIDVVEYLHYRNIVHCDIKADNIMVAPYIDRPVTLIDFDKAYTAWLDNTPGDPAKYNCDDCADGRIDLCGIGKIAALLGQNTIAAACQEKDAAIGEIRKILNRRQGRKLHWIWPLLMAATAFCVVVILKIDRHDNTSTQQPSSVVLSEDTIMEKSAAVPEPVVERQDQKSRVATVSVAKTTKDNSGELEEIINRYYGPLSRRHDYLRALAADSTATINQLKTVLTSYAADQMEAQNQIISEVTVLYGLSNPLESVVILSRIDAWNRFMKLDNEINLMYSREIKRRVQKEVRSSGTTSGMPEEADSLSRLSPHS